MKDGNGTRHVHFRLEEDLFAELKEQASREGISLQQAYTDITRLYVEGRLKRIINGEQTRSGYTSMFDKVNRNR